MNEKYKELRNMKSRIEAFKQELAKDFRTSIKELFVKYPTLKEASCSINNHEFNDGEATYFSVYYEDGFDIEYTEDSEENDRLTDVINKELVELFDATSDVHETLFEGEYGTITLHRNM